MRLLSFAVGDYVSFGAISAEGDRIVDVGRLLQFPTLGAVLRGGGLHRAVSLGTSSKATIALDEIRYLPTIPDPEKIICIGINYGNRNAEYKDGEKPPEYPSVFMRTPGSLVGHLEPIWNPPESEQLDYEGEIVLVIGKGGRRIAAADAWQHVAGLTLMNEGSVPMVCSSACVFRRVPISAPTCPHSALPCRPICTRRCWPGPTERRRYMPRSKACSRTPCPWMPIAEPVARRPATCLNDS
jgi:hypothetical protein